VAPTRGRD